MAADFLAAMQQATQLTRTAKVGQATRAIKAAIARWSFSGGPTPDDGPTRTTSLYSAESDVTAAPQTSSAGVAFDQMAVPQAETFKPPFSIPLDVTQVLRKKDRSRPRLPDGAQFLERSFTCPAGARTYKLYVPASSERPCGLIVMLHGCKQDPDDFATGTNMNAIAELNGMLVAYPRQSCSANPSSCWNWFDRGHQGRGAGEPAIISGITRAVMSEFRLEPQQVFVAGLSAGGAMAAVMAETYPELYAGVGIHSGIAYRAATDLISAFSAMRGVEAVVSDEPKRGFETNPRLRTIVFQGSADQTVAPSNATRIVAAATGDLRPDTEVIFGQTASGRSYARTVVWNVDGTVMLEYWLVDGTGHAWSGGSAAGSYTDPEGPDASAEMVRFFLGR